MSRQRYEPVPQRDEAIILESIQNSPSYNYNTGVPNSISSAASVSSQQTASILAPSVPSSPPPSFHTHSSPATPRPAPSHLSNHTNPSYAELWGVAPSTIGGLDPEMGLPNNPHVHGPGTGGIGTSNDALATIAGLKQRVEWLEESIGRLLLERENNPPEGVIHKGSNCCVTLTDASPDLERRLTSGYGSNCCVKFKRTNTGPEAERLQRQRLTDAWVALRIALMFGLLFLIVVLVFGVRGGGGPRGPGQRGE